MTEIILGIIIACGLVYLFYLYLGWCDTYATSRDLYKLDPLFVLEKDREVVESYGSFILPTYLADTYKPIRFRILYTSAKYF